MNWHYSKLMPQASRSMWRFGVYEDERFVGAVVYGLGATPRFAHPYKVANPNQVVELVRVALTTHQTPVSRIVAVCNRLLARRAPHVRLIVSYADPGQGHHGGIYQAGNWLYVGTTGGRYMVRVFGEIVHPRTSYDRYGSSGMRKLREIDPDVSAVPMPPKHKYLMPLDDAMRTYCLPLVRPYPKRA